MDKSSIAALSALGYAPDREGLSKFQQDRGLEVTGEPNGQTRSLLTLLTCNDPQEALLGDADGDGRLTVKDAGKIVGSLLWGRGEAQAQWDADGSGKVDIKDAAFLLKCFLGRATPKTQAPPEPAATADDAAEQVLLALSTVSPLRRQLVQTLLPFAIDPHGEKVLPYPKSLYIWGANLFSSQGELFYPTAMTVETLALKKPAFFTAGRRELMLMALQHAAAKGERLTGADCSGAIVGLWRKLGLWEAGFDATAKELMQAPYSSAIRKEDLLPGDLVGFEGHIGLYAGAGRVIEWVGGAYGCQLTRLTGRCCWSFTERRLIHMQTDFVSFSRPSFLIDED